MAINFRSNTIIKNLSIGPTVGPPIVNLFSNQTEINESGTVTFSITTQNIEAGTLIPYSISGVTSTDISPSPLSGNFVVGTTETISITAVNDEDTDGDKTMVMTLPSNGNLTASCIVRDTSQTPVFPTLAVGAFRLFSRGAVYIYDIANPSATPTRLLAPSTNDSLGHSVAVNSNYILAGATGEDANHSNATMDAGGIYVYDKNNPTSTPTVLTAANRGDGLGKSVAATDDYIVAGTYYDDSVVDYGGAIYVWDANNLSASPTKLIPSDMEAFDYFGHSVAVAGNTIVASSQRDNTLAGSVYVYDATNLSAAPTKLAPSGLEQQDNFGISVAVTSNHIVVGADGDDDQASNAGAVYVYDVNNLSATPTKLVSPTAVEIDAAKFGCSVAADSNYIVVGAKRAGSVYVYDATNLSASPTLITPPDTSPGFGGDFGNVVQIAGNYFVAGAVSVDSGVGAVYVYDLTNLSATPIKFSNPESTTGTDFGFAAGLG